MTAKQLLKEMIQERKDQIKYCEEAMDNYSDDRDQVEAFRRKKENNEFMLEVLKRKVIENSPAL